MLTYEKADALVSYNPETGEMRWRIDGRKRKAGTPAGGSLMKGYKRLKIDYQNYPHHRVAWLLMTGEWPPDQIDHINGVRTDNRWCNLRAANCSQNLANRTMKTKLGLPKGVQIRKNGRFSAQAWLGGHRVCLGTYDTAAEAHSAYLSAARSHFGEFARS